MAKTIDMDTIAVEKELVGLEERYWKAIQDNDVEAAKRLTDFPCLVTGPQGPMKVDEPTYTKMIQRPAYTIHRITLGDDSHVRLLGDDVAVVAYTFHEELTVEGKPVTLDGASSSTWVRRQGRWACAHHSESILGDPYGRDRTAKAR